MLFSAGLCLGVDHKKTNNKRSRYLSCKSLCRECTSFCFENLHLRGGVGHLIHGFVSTHLDVLAGIIGLVDVVAEAAKLQRILTGKFGSEKEYLRRIIDP